MANTPKFSKRVADQIIEAVRVCMPLHRAASEAGISKDTLDVWQRRPEKRFRDFARELEQAQAFAQRALLSVVLKAAQNGEWRAATWVLERGYHRVDFGFKAQVEHSGNVQIDIRAEVEIELRAILAAVRAELTEGEYQRVVARLAARDSERRAREDEQPDDCRADEGDQPTAH